jgi:hypothetical protein
MQRTAVLVALGFALAVVGGLLLWRGAADGPGGLAVAGILVAIAGLVCLRVGFWRIRIQAMTRAGLAMRGPDEGDGRDRDA